MTYLSPEQSAEKRSQRAGSALEQFKQAGRLAGEHGLILMQRTNIHYQLAPRDGKWLLNIYPSNRRLYHDPHKRGPYLRVPENWTLLDVVKAAIEEAKRCQK